MTHAKVGLRGPSHTCWPMSPTILATSILSRPLMKAVPTADCAQTSFHCSKKMAPGGSTRTNAPAVTFNEPCVRGHVPETLNEAAGGALGNNSLNQRVLDLEKFTVAIVA